jgi:hypothetical protein
MLVAAPSTTVTCREGMHRIIAAPAVFPVSHCLSVWAAILHSNRTFLLNWYSLPHCFYAAYSPVTFRGRSTSLLSFLLSYVSIQSTEPSGNYIEDTVVRVGRASALELPSHITSFMPKWRKLAN